MTLPEDAKPQNIRFLRISEICRPDSALLIFAGLIAYCTAGLAGRLAGCLTLSAASVYHALLIISGIKSLYMLHISLISFPVLHNVPQKKSGI